MASEAPRIDPQRSPLHPPPYGQPAGHSDGITVRIDVRDPEVLTELRSYPEGPERDEYLRLALRIGVLSLRMASGSLDVGAIKRESANLVDSLRQLLQERQQQISNSLTQVLGEYLDPGKGKLEARLATLTKPGGEIESLLQSQVGGDNSVLARTLTAHVGEQSKLFRMLSPEEAGGLRAQVQNVLQDALEAQRKQLLAQFSLDEPGSALRRLADTLQQENQKISREFSLDKADSALSRMTRAIEEAQQNINKRLTLDEENSPLSVLDRAMKERVEEIQKRAEEFQREVRQLLEGMAARRSVAARSTLQGLEFEEAFGRILQPMVGAYGDEFEDCRATSGIVSRSKKGDFVARLSEDSGAPGAGIVWEAKSSGSYSVKAAREELAESRRNRDSQIGVFVWEKARSPQDEKPPAAIRQRHHCCLGRRGPVDGYSY
jgi:hypothetical protein